LTPAQRDRNLFRARRITGAIAGASLAACGLFAGLAASATKHAAATTTKTKTKTTTTVAPTVTTTQAATTTTIAPVVVTPTQSSPVASSGGS
jgi:carbohydrate-binding DOMON domain-containing protein